MFVLYRSAAHRDLHSFPTRRSSDLQPVPSLPQPAQTRHIRSEVVDEDDGGAGPRQIEQSPEGLVRHVLRSEEHTSELQSLTNLVCRLLLEKKNKLHSGEMS